MEKTESQIEPGNSSQINDVAVKQLSVGLLNIYQPKLDQVKKQLIELCKKQKSLENELHSENLRFTETQCSDDLNQFMNKVKIYKEKLVGIKKDMNSLYDRSNKLKKRALKLEQQKQKQALDKAKQRDHEEQLIAKTSSLNV